MKHVLSEQPPPLIARSVRGAVCGAGLRTWGFWLRVWGLRFRLWGFWFGVWGLRVSGP